MATAAHAFIAMCAPGAPTFAAAVTPAWENSTVWRPSESTESVVTLTSLSTPVPYVTTRAAVTAANAYAFVMRAPLSSEMCGNTACRDVNERRRSIGEIACWQLADRCRRCEQRGLLKLRTSKVYVAGEEEIGLSWERMKRRVRRCT